MDAASGGGHNIVPAPLARVPQGFMFTGDTCISVWHSICRWRWIRLASAESLVILGGGGYLGASAGAAREGDGGIKASGHLVRWGGLAAILGGVLWIAFAVRLASLPEGCIGAVCDLPGRTMRPTNSLVALLFVAAGTCTALAVIVLLLRVRVVGSLSRLDRVGVILLGAGALLLLIAMLVQEFAYSGDFPQMPLFVIPAGLALILGFLLLAIAILRAGVLPRWANTLLVFGTLILVSFNDQNAQALLAIPFGLAWVGIGYALWSEASTTKSTVPKT